MLDINTATNSTFTSHHTSLTSENATETGNSGVESCYERDLSKLAYDYVTATQIHSQKSYFSKHIDNLNKKSMSE